MAKRVIDLTADELDRFATEAWDGAAREALAKGLSVTGSRDGRRIRCYPDGRVQDLGPIAPLDDLDLEGSTPEKPKSSVS
jgi:hypothetical protein